MSVVSVSFLPIKDESGPPAALKEVGEKLLATPELLHAYRGKPLENDGPKAVELFDVWSSQDALKAAGSSPEALEAKAAFDKHFENATDPRAKPHHNTLILNDDLTKVAAAPVVQVRSMFVPTSNSTADFDAAWADGAKNAGSGGPPEGFVAGVHGWNQDEIDTPKGTKVKVFTVLTGWESLDKAKAATENEKAKGIFSNLDKFVEHSHVRLISLEKVK